MNGRKLDSENDIYLKNGKVCRNSSFKDTVLQRVKTVLQTFIGELFTDPRVGVAWYEKVLNESMVGLDLAKQEIKSTIESVDGVKNVTALDVAFSERKLSVKYNVKLSDESFAEGEV